MYSVVVIWSVRSIPVVFDSDASALLLYLCQASGKMVLSFILIQNRQYADSILARFTWQSNTAG
jgi:hypothetical protein